jgi:hypothetical protein
VRKLLLPALALLSLAAVLPQAGAYPTRRQVKPDGDATIRNAPPGTGSGYVVGTARANAKMDVLGVANGLDFGFVFGNFRHCGWVFDSALSDIADKPKVSACSAGPLHRFRFRSFSNGERNCKPRKCSDGSTAHVDGNQPGCAATGQAGRAYANVNPFSVPAKPHDLYGVLKQNAALAWRYVTKDGHWVMVHDRFVHSRPGFPPTASDWYFVNRSCIRFGK